MKNKIETPTVDVFKIQHALAAQRDMKERLSDKNFLFVETMNKISLLQKIKDEGVQVALEESFSIDKEFILKNSKLEPEEIDQQIDLYQKLIIN